MMRTAKGTMLHKPPMEHGSPLTRPLGGHLQGHALLSERRSNSYDWRTVFSASFRQHGALARRDPLGRPVFNFIQEVWITPGTCMDWSEQYTESVKSLATNILFHYCHRLGNLADFHPATEESRAKVMAFAEIFLLSAPDHGWRIQPTTLEDWCEEFL